MKNDALKRMKNSYLANAYQKLKNETLQSELIESTKIGRASCRERV